MGIPSVFKIDITRNASYFFLRSYITSLFGYISLHFVSYLYLVPHNSFIMLVSILLFQHYSCQICNLLFSKLCQHNRLRPNLNRNQVACGPSPGGGGVSFPLSGPLIISLRLGYLKAVSTVCWQIVITSEVTTVKMSSVNTT